LGQVESSLSMRTDIPCQAMYPIRRVPSKNTDHHHPPPTIEMTRKTSSAIRTSLRHFDPASFEIDILQKEATGLGRGKGFSFSEAYSVLDDGDIVTKVGDRMIDLLSLLIRKGWYTKEEVADGLDIQEKGVSEADSEGNAELSSEENGDLEEAAEYCEERIYYALDLDTNDIDHDAPISDRLRWSVKRLVGEYLDLSEVAAQI